jgi:membrane protease YdiL (CAAX protease family)
MLQIVSAVVTGVLVLVGGNLPWGILARLNGLGPSDHPRWTMVPWAIVPMALYVWAYWQVIGGGWGRGAGAAARRALLRANALSPRVWLASLGAGALGFVTLLALLSLAARLVQLPASAAIATPPEMPLVTAVLLLAMQSVVAGVTEEAAFRGYMQSMIERHYGVIVAVVVNGLFFGLLHFGNHPADVLLMLPYYIAVSAVYGGLTWAADSILPATVLHSAGDMVVLTRWWATGLPEWQLGATAPALVGDTGLDLSFLITAMTSAVLTVLTAFAYLGVRRTRLESCADTSRRFRNL